MATRNPLRPAFNWINDSLWIYSPPESITKNDSADPDTILLFAWGNAERKNIIKYTNHYMELYPKARIILFETSFADLVFHNEEKQLEPLKPAVDALRSAPEDSKTLVHLFSNGGSYKFYELAKAYHKYAGKTLPVDMITFDSAPGLPDFWRSMTAFQTQIPQLFILYWPINIMLYLYMIVTLLRHRLTGASPITRSIWEGTNDPRYIDKNAKRLYLFSKTDELINWQDIKEHASVAKKNGCHVQAVEFVGSKHVAHVIVGKEQYWRYITRGWNGLESPSDDKSESLE